MRPVPTAIAHLCALPVLVRQKAKVLGHNDRDSEAVDLIVSIEHTVGGNSKLERGLALRGGGTSAARSHRFDVAARLFGKATAAFDDIEGYESLAAGARVDLPMALWDAGERTIALRCLADAFDILGALDANASRQNERAHQFARAAGGLFYHDVELYPTTLRPTIAYGGASALSLSTENPLDVDLKPLSDAWRVLALVEEECSVDAGIDACSRAAQTGLAIASIELMISCVRYGHALKREGLSGILCL